MNEWHALRWNTYPRQGTPPIHALIKRGDFLAKMVKAVKMSDIAAKLNISTVTVSKALSDQKGVSEEMRNKIKHLAQDMGYKYTAPVKDKDVGKSYNMGVLVSRRYLDSNDSFYGKMCQEITAKAMLKGFLLLFDKLQQRKAAL